jgi:biotin operon repressor
MGSATAMTDCAVLRIEKRAMVQRLHREQTLSDLFVAYLLARNIRYEEDLVDLLAHFGKDGVPETVIPTISQETLAEMIGTTRSRVSFFMNRFRKLGFTAHFSTSFFTISFRTEIPTLDSNRAMSDIRHLLDLVRRAASFSSRSAPPTELLCYERFPIW